MANRWRAGPSWRAGCGRHRRNPSSRKSTCARTARPSTTRSLPHWPPRNAWAWPRSGWLERSSSLLENASCPGRASGLVLFRALHPDEGLDVDHVACLETRLAVQVAADDGRKRQQGLIDAPGRLGPVDEIESIGPRRLACHHRFEKQVLVGPCDEAEH